MPRMCQFLIFKPEFNVIYTQRASKNVSYVTAIEAIGTSGTATTDFNLPIRLHDPYTPPATRKLPANSRNRCSTFLSRRLRTKKKTDNQRLMSLQASRVHVAAYEVSVQSPIKTSIHPSVQSPQGQFNTSRQSTAR